MATSVPGQPPSNNLTAKIISTIESITSGQIGMGVEYIDRVTVLKILSNPYKGNSPLQKYPAFRLKNSQKRGILRQIFLRNEHPCWQRSLARG